MQFLQQLVHLALSQPLDEFVLLFLDEDFRFQRERYTQPPAFDAGAARQCDALQLAGVDEPSVEILVIRQLLLLLQRPQYHSLNNIFRIHTMNHLVIEQNAA